MPTFGLQPLIVLVRPQMGENIGAAARAMWNFGLDKMRIVSPRDGWPNSKAVAMSSGAGRLLEEAIIIESISAAIFDCSFVFATTARSRDMIKSIYTPEQAMKITVEKLAQGEKIGILFGPERSGLENDDIMCANALISVPVNPQSPSLNLSHCVLLIAYELLRQRTNSTPKVTKISHTKWAVAQELEALANHYEEQLSEIGFFYPDTKSISMKRNLRNFWSRLPLTKADVQMLHGILRQFARWKKD
ncbi:MAG: RNA methyltransferase [Aestuariivita sp.]|nr:RNA methyltransferase [Aestuariivita sp.]